MAGRSRRDACIAVPRSAFRVPTSGEPHYFPRRAPDLPRPRGRGATPRRGRDVRCGAEAAVGTAHHARRAQPDPPGVTLPARGARRGARPHRHRPREQGRPQVQGHLRRGERGCGEDGRTRVEDALRELGHGPGDVRWVINTHLHFDHAGGNTYRDGAGAVLRSFPNARYLVQRRELEFARHTNERTAASYLPHNFEPVSFELLDGEAEPLPGIRCLPTPGHVPFHQSVLVASGGERACFLADLVPTTAHLPLPWILGYDLQPLVTLESKRRLYARAEAEGWLLVFEHDAAVATGRLGREEKGFALVEQVLAG